VRRFEAAVAMAAEDFTPDFILVSSGFDAMAGDPLGNVLLEPEDMYRMTRHLIEGVGARCDGRVVALLEGGYVPERLGDGTVAVLRALAGLRA
jgi:acetoin utilization deacetylase AcuC-like enzyme